jgi:hypothetical protein
LAHRVKLEITRLNNDITGCLDNGVDLSQLRSRQSLMLLNKTQKTTSQHQK